MAESLMREEQRENWGSRTGFILAAIGSAVGLGNLWGFPYKLYKYGGGAFLIPYIIAMLVIGLPVLIMEFSLGHMTQRAAPDAFAKAGRRKEPIGWWGILLGFVIITYYPIILAWCLSFLGQAISGIFHNGGELPWAGMGKAGAEAAKNYFLFDFCNQWRGQGVAPWALGSIKPEIVFCLAGIWMLMFACIFRGVNIVSKVVLWTVPLPWIMLLILMYRGLTLPGAESGLAYYLNPDWSQLLQPTTWRFAFGQVFFSMSLAFGVMITYASFLHRKSDINNNAVIIGLGDLGTSFVAGIAIFATLGAMSAASAEPVESVVGEGTVGMAFMAIPYALAQLPGSAWFSLVFFFALITLGIDSAFSITESVLASIVDKTGWNRTATLWGISFTGLAAGLVYASRGGLAWLEHIDGFINGPWGIAMLGMAECVVLGWLFRLSRLRRHANERSDWKLGPWWDWNIRLVVPTLLAALFVWSLYDTVTSPDGFLFDKTGRLIVPVMVGLILAGLAPALAVVLSLVRSRTATASDSLRAADEPTGPAQPARPVAAVLAGAGIICASLGCAVVIATKLTCDSAGSADGGECSQASASLAWGLPASLAYGVFGAGVVASILATVFGCVATVRAERTGSRPHWTAQLAGALGTLSVGGAVGIAMAFFVMTHAVQTKAVKHIAEMQPAAYIMMAIMLALIIGGLGWCFYRAIKAAAASQKAESQTSEI